MYITHIFVSSTLSFLNNVKHLLLFPQQGGEFAFYFLYHFYELFILQQNIQSYGKKSQKLVMKFFTLQSLIKLLFTLNPLLYVHKKLVISLKVIVSPSFTSVLIDSLISF